MTLTNENHRVSPGAQNQVPDGRVPGVMPLMDLSHYLQVCQDQSLREYLQKNINLEVCLAKAATEIYLTKLHLDHIIQIKKC